MQPHSNDHSRKSGDVQLVPPEAATCVCTSDAPLISAIMPTYGRPELVNESVAMFLSQDYENKELVILNDCVGQSFCFSHPQVTIVNHPERFGTLGEKRNACIEHAKGEIIAVWDDDDIYLPWRLSDAVDELLCQKSVFYRPSEFWAYWGDTKLHDNQSIPSWVNHAFCCFTKSLWKTVGGYPSQSLGEDAIFFDRIHNFLDLPFIKSPVAKFERPAILRGVSPYKHLSIDGGKQPLKVTPGVYDIVPSPIVDDCLRQSVESLIATHAVCVARLATLAGQCLSGPDRPALSICISLKNRSRINHEDQILELFPKCVASIADATRKLNETLLDAQCHQSPVSNPLKIELVVADFCSDDCAVAEWIEEAAAGMTLKHLSLNEDFSRGRGLNLAVRHASSDRILLLDADMLVTPQLIQTGIEVIDEQTAYFPVFRNLGIAGNLLDLEQDSFGNVFLSKRLFHAAGGIPEFKSWGGEDNVLYERIKEIANIRREEAKGFHHQWHPDRCRHENYVHPARQDYFDFHSRQSTLRETRGFAVSHVDWAGQLYLYPDGKMQACNGDEGHYEWSNENVLTLNWDSWPVEKLLPASDNNHWSAEGYHFEIKELPRTPV